VVHEVVLIDRRAVKHARSKIRASKDSVNVGRVRAWIDDGIDTTSIEVIAEDLPDWRLVLVGIERSKRDAGEQDKAGDDQSRPHVDL